MKLLLDQTRNYIFKEKTALTKTFLLFMILIEHLMTENLHNFCKLQGKRFENEFANYPRQRQAFAIETVAGEILRL